MQCQPRYLSLCKQPPLMSRDGYAGENAHIYLPFHGYHFFSGAQYEFPESTVPQNTALTVAGTPQANTFSKNGCGCG